MCIRDRAVDATDDGGARFGAAALRQMKLMGAQAQRTRDIDQPQDLLFEQTVEDAVPVSVTVLGNVALMCDDFPATSDQLYFADGVTPFEYRFEHRLSYAAQAIVARRFNERFSLQVAPVLMYRNLAPVGGSNLTMALAMSTRWKVTTKGSILFEVCPLLAGGPEEDQLEPIALGYELATQGHVFQIVLASAQEMIDQRLYSTAPSRYDEGYFHMGFNIARILFVKPKTSQP